MSQKKPFTQALEALTAVGATGTFKAIPIHGKSKCPNYAPNTFRLRSIIDAEVREVIQKVANGRLPWPLLMTGNAGTGKTCAVLCLLDAMGPDGIFMTLSDLTDDLIAASKNELHDVYGMGRNNRKQVWHAWFEPTLGVLDELGARDRVTDHQYEVLKKAIDVREGLPTVYISNMTLSQLASLYDDRIGSRLGSGTVLTMNGPDKRTKT